MSEHLYYSILARKADELWDELDWSVDVLGGVPFEQARREAQAALTEVGIVETGVGAWWDSGAECRMGCAPMAMVYPDQVCVGHLLETYEISAFRPRIVACLSCQSDVSISHRQWSTHATIPCPDCGQPAPVAGPAHRPTGRHHSADRGHPSL